MTYQRGDIVRLKEDQDIADMCLSDDFRADYMSRRYVVLETESRGGRFSVGGEIVECPAEWHVWRIGAPARNASAFVFETEMIATGERAEEVT